jgi:DNA-binding NarL/FixJ family response regulator
MRNLAMRKTRLIYVENDPSLRGFITELLSSSPQLELLGSYSGGSETFGSNKIQSADIALIDFSLEQNGLNGVELGIALRNMNENLGLVIYSQYAVKEMVSRVPKSMRGGWSFFDKSATMQLDDYIHIIKQTSSGKGNWEEVLGSDVADQESEANIFFMLTPRQRSIMALASEGKNPQDIAMRLDLSYSYVRKELSRAYQVLVPNADASADLRTAAVIRYRELMRL